MGFKGKVIAVLPVKSGTSQSGNEWATQQYVVESHEQYPQKMVFEVFGKDRIKEANISIGDELEVEVNFDAREYQGKWYNSIKAWKVAHINSAPQPAAQPAQPVPPYNAQANDGLPF